MIYSLDLIGNVDREIIFKFRDFYFLLNVFIIIYIMFFYFLRSSTHMYFTTIILSLLIEPRFETFLTPIFNFVLIIRTWVSSLKFAKFAASFPLKDSLYSSVPHGLLKLKDSPQKFATITQSRSKLAQKIWHSINLLSSTLNTFKMAIKGTDSSNFSEVSIMETARLSSLWEPSVVVTECPNTWNIPVVIQLPSTETRLRT